MRDWRFYAVTIGSVLFIANLKFFVNEALHIQSPILLFFVAVTISAWVGGFFHGILATFLSILIIANYFVQDEWNTPIWSIRFAFYFLDCFAITWICGKLRSSRNQLNLAYVELQKTQDDLQNRENQISKIFESNMLGIVISDLSGRILEANDYMVNLLGLDIEKLNSGDLNWKKFTVPEDLEKSEAALSALKTSGQVKPFEKEYLNSKGERVAVVVGAAKTKDDTIVAFVLDITERKRIERELSEAKGKLEESVSLRTRQLTEANKSLSASQRFLDSVVDNIPNMIFVKEAKDLRFVRFNKAGTELLGVDAHHMLGKNDYDLFPLDQAEFFIKKDREVLERRSKLEIEEEPLQTGRGTRFLRTIKLPILDEKGEPKYLLGISEDITEKKSAENHRLELLQEQAARYEAEKSASRFSFFAKATEKLNESLDIQTSLDRFAEVIVQNMASWCVIDLFSADRTLLRRMVCASDSAAHLGELPRELAISPTLDLVVNRKKKLLFQNLDMGLLKEILVEDELVAKVRDVAGASLIIVPLLYQGRTSGCLTLIAKEGDTPFTDLDLVISQDLAKRASLAIENARLYHKATAANRAKTSFLANMSHEIRTPLGAMLGFAEIALDNKHLPLETKAQVETILKNGQQLLQLVDEVLDISKVESEKIDIEKIEFSPKKVIEETLSLLRVKAIGKGLDLVLKSNSKLPASIKTDLFRMRQILINIVGNAIKFTEKGQVTVEVNFNPSSINPQVGLLEFSITDTGIGISKDQVKALFEPFSQVDSSMSRKFGGTGLGLFLARKLARLLGGDVSLKEAELGQGSEFNFYLKVEYSDKEVEALTDVPEVKNATSHQGRVLLVEDSEENRVIVKTFLNKLGIRSDVAVNGREGVQKAQASHYDVVLMDIQMPEVDGFEAIQQLRREGYAGTVIALTAHAMKGDREKCLEYGFDEYLCKPISRQSLYSCLEQFIPLAH